MFDLPLLLAFLTAATILTVTPGVDTAMVLRAATIEGRRPAVLAAIGIALGCLVWGGAAAIGLGALLRASLFAYTALKFAGAAYLAWLGAKLILRPRSTLAALDQHGEAAGRQSAFWRGLLTNLLNPKVGIFYVTFLPQFLPDGMTSPGYPFFLASLHVLLTLAWFAILIAASLPLGRLLRRPSAMRSLDRLTGAVFLGFGFRLATSRLR